MRPLPAPPKGPATARTPSILGEPQGQPAAPRRRALLRHYSTTHQMPDEHGPPVPEYARRITLSSAAATPSPPRPRPDRAARRGYPARGHPRGLRLLLPRPRALGIPLRTAGASLVQDLHPSDRGPHGTHTAPSSPTATCTPRNAPHRCSSSVPARAAHPRDIAAATKPDRGTGPGTSSARSPLTTRRLPRVSARRHGKIRCPSAPRHWPWTGTGPRSSPRPGPACLLHPADLHRLPGHPGQTAAETRLPLRRAPPLL